ncbi:MAG: serine/threonine protein kinase [Polyangiaceae bacterium]|nr:serine/threonine protein kinase [Polyangiaceae bacterium]
MEARAPEPALPRPGDEIERYSVIGEVARGGMAAVFAVRRSGIGGFDKVLALKMMLPNLASEAQAVERFLDEARIASHIAHANVIQVFDVGTHLGAPYLVMEFLRGQSLAAVTRKAKKSRHTLSLGLRLGVLARAAEGLAAAHGTAGADGHPLGIVHRDVSPQNIHIGYTGEVKVVDFGIAAARGRIASTQSGEFRGKLAYAAPEQIRRDVAVDARADAWALGVVAWELLAQRRLFRGEDESNTLFNVLQLEVPALRTVAPDVPPEVASVVMRCLERDVSLRPESLDELASIFDLAAVAASGGRRADVAREMEHLFREDRAREDERLAAAQRGGGHVPLQLESTGGGSITALSREPAPRTAKRSKLPWLLGVAAVLGVSLLLAWRGLSGEPEAAAPSASTSASSAEARIAVHVPADARLVLVDGRRRDERPLVIGLTGDASAEVQVVAADGREVSRRVRRTDDGITLTLPAPMATAEPAPPASSAPPAAVRAPAKGGTKKPTGPLLADPY